MSGTPGSLLCPRHTHVYMSVGFNPLQGLRCLLPTSSHTSCTQELAVPDGPAYFTPVHSAGCSLC